MHFNFLHVPFLLIYHSFSFCPFLLSFPFAIYPFLLFLLHSHPHPSPSHPLTPHPHPLTRPSPTPHTQVPGRHAASARGARDARRGLARGRCLCRHQIRGRVRHALSATAARGSGMVIRGHMHLMVRGVANNHQPPPKNQMVGAIFSMQQYSCHVGKPRNENIDLNTSCFTP